MLQLRWWTGRRCHVSSASDGLVALYFKPAGTYVVTAGTYVVTDGACNSRYLFAVDARCFVACTSALFFVHPTWKQQEKQSTYKHQSDLAISVLAPKSLQGVSIVSIVQMFVSTWCSIYLLLAISLFPFFLFVR